MMKGVPVRCHRWQAFLMGHGRFDDDVGALDIGVVNLAVVWDMSLMRARQRISLSSG